MKKKIKCAANIGFNTIQLIFYISMSLGILILLYYFIFKLWPTINNTLPTVNNALPTINKTLPLFEDILDAQKCSSNYNPKTNIGKIVYDLSCLGIDTNDPKKTPYSNKNAPFSSMGEVYEKIYDTVNWKKNIYNYY